MLLFVQKGNGPISLSTAALSTICCRCVGWHWLYISSSQWLWFRSARRRVTKENSEFWVSQSAAMPRFCARRREAISVVGKCSTASDKFHQRRELESNVQHQADIADLLACQILQHGNQVQQLVVVRIAEPTGNRHGVLRMKDV